MKKKAVKEILRVLGLGEKRHEVHARMDATNARTLLWAMPLLAFVSAITFLFGNLVCEPGTLVLAIGPLHLTRLAALIVALILNAVMFAIGWLRHRKKKGGHRFFEISYYAYVMCISVYYVLISICEYRFSTHIADFAVRMMLLYGILYLQPIFDIIAVSASFIAYMSAINTLDLVEFSDNRNLVLIWLVIIIVAIAHYGSCYSSTFKDMKLQDANKQLQEFSLYDELTGMKNRYAFREDYPMYRRKKLIVMMTDIDDFKYYNDTYGHDVGDIILKAYGKGLREAFGEGSCYRYGGDEALVVCQDMDEADFLKKIQQFRESVSNVEVGNKTLHPNFSGGYVWGTARADDDLRTMLRLADAKLYEIKQNHKGRTEGIPYERGKEVGEETLGKMKEAQTQKSGSVDSLTGLPSMTKFRNQSRVALEKIRARNEVPAIAYFNVENLKRFNERCGFAEGDRFLIDIARLLESVFPFDLVSRFAEDHFVVLTCRAGIEEKLETVYEKVKNSRKEIRMHIKAGVYEYSGTDPDISVACDRAKVACDSIHGDYSRHICFYDDELENRFQHRQYILDHFDEAMENGYIRAYYQPIIRNVSGAVCEAEALARWIDPEKGMFSPAEFIPILEEFKLIHRLDIFVLRRICIGFQRRKLAHAPIFPVSVNISRADFELCDIVAEVEKAVDDYKIPKRLIHIEVTESALSRNPAFLMRQIGRFREAGFQVWMDDFGSGYSSLNVLDEFHFDLVKLDMSFMKNFGKSGNNSVILRDTISMLKDLGVRTLAEGVETEEEYRFLRENGCDMSQGYYFSKPVPLDEMIDWKENPARTFETGPEIETYYDEVGLVNLQNPNYADLGEDLSSFALGIPTAVIEYREDKIRYLRTNDAYRGYLGSIGIASEEQSEKMMNDPGRKNAALFRDLVNSGGHSDTWASLDFVVDDNYCTARLKKIAENPTDGAVAFLTVAVNVSSYSSNFGKSEANLAPVQALYSRIDRIGIDDNFFKNEYCNSMRYSGTFELMDAEGSVREFAEKNIRPDEISEFVKYYDRRTILERFRESGNTHLSAMFHTKNTDGNYTWQVYLLIPIEKGGRRQFLSCVRDLGLYDEETIQHFLDSLKKDRETAGK